MVDKERTAKTSEVIRLTKQELVKRILDEMLTKYTIEKRPNHKWWIIYDGFELVCETYTKKNAEQIRRLLSFDKR